ncbi:MAG TPA: HNH endonuclease, partial [Microbacterium sp.]|nr:HNH endonuclease [Microbacterium sp.]
MTTDALPTLTQHLALLDEWLETRREIARLEARATDLLIQRIAVMDEEVAEAPRYRDTIMRSMVAEYSAAGHVSKGSMDFAFADAHALADFPAVSESFAAGKVTGAHVREITR